MDEHRTVSVSRVYVPERVRRLAVARRPRALRGRRAARSPTSSAPTCSSTRAARSSRSSAGPQVTFHTDDALQPRRVRHPGPARARRAATPRRPRRAGRPRPHDGLLDLRPPARGARPARAARSRRGRAMVLAEGKRMLVGAGGAVLGRSRECDIVLDDPNVSRRHAEIRAGRRAAAGRSRDLGSTNGVKVNGRRIDGPDAARARRPPRARAPPTSASWWSSADARARLRRPQVRLPRRPLPVPAVGRAQRAARTCAAARRDGGRRRAGPRRDRAGDAHRHPPARRRRRAAARRRARARATAPASRTTSAAARRSAAATWRSCSRTRSPPRATRGSSARAAPSCSRTSARRTAPTSTRSCSAGRSRCTPATACASATPCSLPALTLMLRVADEFHGSHTGRQRRANEDSLYARAPLFAVADGMGGAQAGEIASGIAVETLGGGDAGERHRRRSASPTLVREANARIHELSRSDERRAGMGTTMTVVLVGEEDVTVAHVGDSRAVPAARRRARAPDPRPLARRGARSRRASSRRRRPAAPAALGHHARARARGPTSRSTRSPRPRATATCTCICCDGLTTMVDEADIERAAARPRRARRRRPRAHRRRQRGRRARQHHRRPVPPRGRRRAAGARRPSSRRARAATTAAAAPADVQAAVEAEPRPRGAPARSPPPSAPGRPPPTRRLRADRALGRRRAEERRRGRPWARRRSSSWRSLGFVGVPIVLGSLIALRSVYFVGANDAGLRDRLPRAAVRAAVRHRPLPGELRVRRARDQVLPHGRRDALLDHELRSHDDAYDLVAPARARDSSPMT